MDCHEVKNLLPVLLGADLPQEDESRIRSHLDGCSACKKEMDNLQATWDLLGQWEPEEPAHDFKQKFWARIAEVETSERPTGWLDLVQKWFRPSRSQRWWKWKTSWVTLGSLAVAMLLITVWIFRPGHPGIPELIESTGQAGTQQEQAAMIEMLSSLSMLEHDDLIEEMELLENFELLLSLEEMSRTTGKNG